MIKAAPLQMSEKRNYGFTHNLHRCLGTKSNTTESERKEFKGNFLNVKTAEGSLTLFSTRLRAAQPDTHVLTRTYGSLLPLHSFIIRIFSSAPPCQNGSPCGGMKDSQDATRQPSCTCISLLYYYVGVNITRKKKTFLSELPGSCFVFLSVTFVPRLHVALQLQREQRAECRNAGGSQSVQKRGFQTKAPRPPAAPPPAPPRLLRPVRLPPDSTPALPSRLFPAPESRSLFALYYSATGMIVREGS